MSDCGCERTVRTGVNPGRSFSCSGGTPIQDASSRSRDLVISHNCSFQFGHLVPECLEILLHKVTVVYCSEEDTTLPLTFPLPTIPTAFRTTTGWHSSSRRSSGGSEKRRELDITVPDSISSLLLGHDMIEPFLWGRELTLRPVRGDFTSGTAVLICYDRRDDRGRSTGGKWRWDERGV